MSPSETTIPAGEAEQECPNCGRPMSPRARMCPTCRSFRQEWKNLLSFYGSAVGVVAIIISAITFVSDAGPRVWASVFRADAIKTVYFEYPGKAAFVNTGAHSIIIESISLTWPLAGTKPVDLSVGRLVGPGEVVFVDLPSQYKEPEGIDRAEWVRGNGDQPGSQVFNSFDTGKSQLLNAFDIGRPKRCAVFHVYARHPFLRLLDSLSNPHLITVPAQALVHEYLVSSGSEHIDSIDNAQTAFLAISGCVPPVNGELTK